MGDFCWRTLVESFYANHFRSYKGTKNGVAKFFIVNQKYYILNTVIVNSFDWYFDLIWLHRSIEINRWFLF